VIYHVRDEMFVMICILYMFVYACLCLDTGSFFLKKNYLFSSVSRRT
jgi:hypothetical protein